ncbi:AAA family ATPase [Luteimonas vadosa]|uniref:AAA family ATPase n=1 Tax=Luteimonas vadosa TaxID=1165507 RepID=A0ABP9E5M7_9GAMM
MFSPVLKRFKIAGLHGYKDVVVDFDGPARIVVAENGSGKTTIFNALYSTISRKFHRLSALSFDYVEVELFDSLLPITIKKEHLGRINEQIVEEIGSIASQASLESSVLTDFLQSTYTKGGYQSFIRHPIVNRIYLNSPFDHEDLADTLDSLADGLDGSNVAEAKEAREALGNAFKDVEILYLPTYRRIELPLMRKFRTRGVSAKNRLAHSHRRRAGFAGLDEHFINFGLADVEDALSQLTDEIEKQSNMEYRAISATILDEILRDQVEKEGASDQSLPDIDSLSRFLNRVSRHGSTDLSLDAIKRLYDSGEIQSKDKLWLRYFLGRLNRVISRTRETELKLERFVEISNQYLKSSSDEKELTYDPHSMKVVVKNSWTGSEIALDDLSSGEKQVVSLMAKLYLSDAPKFIMIDEPELSLSIDWQRKILPDVLNSESVAQMLAITHSPFIFDNALDPIAGPLAVTRSPRVTQDAT